MTKSSKKYKKQKQPKAKYTRFITPVVTCGTYCLQINTEYDDGYCYGFDNTLWMLLQDIWNTIQNLRYQKFVGVFIQKTRRIYRVHS